MQQKKPSLRLLHTSDWHIGQNFYGYDRLLQQKSVLCEIVGIAARSDVDAILISGDVFHTAQPSAAAQKVLADTLIALRHECPDARIIITAGNHDSASRHEAYSALWQELGVTAIGIVDRTDTDEGLDRLIVAIAGKGYVAAVPYIYTRNVSEDFYTRLSERLALRNPDRRPAVLMAHTAVHGCRYSGHADATEKTVGGIESVALSSLGAGYSYIALGHIHVPHTLSEGSRPSTTARYCGSPMAMSFDEDFSHSVSIVDISDEGVEIEEILISDPCPPVNVPASGALPWEEALLALGKLPEDLDAYIRLNVETDGFLPFDANEQIEAALSGKKCRFCILNTRRKSSSEPTEMTEFTVSEFRNLAPAGLAERFCADTGIEFDEDMRSLFAAAAREALKETPEA